jgi:hypothetical protein
MKNEGNFKPIFQRGWDAYLNPIHIYSTSVIVTTHRKSIEDYSANPIPTNHAHTFQRSEYNC